MPAKDDVVVSLHPDPLLLLHHFLGLYFVDAAAAGKHVVCEKPLAMNLEECDKMIAACPYTGVLLMYAEDMMFAPKYVRAKELVDEGALGRLPLGAYGPAGCPPLQGGTPRPEAH